MPEYCGNCMYYDGEECTYGKWEGCSKDDDSEACDNFESPPSDSEKGR
jgi:hypothetical protein